MNARAAAAAYTAAEGADHYAGRWIDEAGRLVVAFTHDAQQHGERIRALADPGERIVVVAARHTYRELIDLTDAIDVAELEREGITPLSIGVDERANRVEFEVAGAPKERVVAHLHRRYGDILHVEVVAPQATQHVFASLDGWTPTDDDSRIELHYAEGGAFVRIEVLETDDHVAVAVVEDSLVGAHSAVYIPATAVAELSEPLAGRPVRDAASGRSLRQGTGLP